VECHLSLKNIIENYPIPDDCEPPSSSSILDSWKKFRKPRASRSFGPIEEGKAKEKEEKPGADLVVSNKGTLGAYQDVTRVLAQEQGFRD